MNRTVALRIPVGDDGAFLEGLLCVPDSAWGVVVFAHGSGSSRNSPRNTYVAEALQAAGFATLLFDLLLEEEQHDRTKVFDIVLLTARLMAAIRHLREAEDAKGLPIGLFGASTGAAAALAAAAFLGDEITAVVSRGGRPDLAFDLLPRVSAATLLIVGGMDNAVIGLNRSAAEKLRCRNAVEIIPGATHLFEEPGALDAVIRHASAWFSANIAAGGLRT